MLLRDKEKQQRLKKEMQSTLPFLLPPQQQRLKKEMQFARESSTTLPSVDSQFRIQVALPNNRRRDKTSKEFGDSLMVFQGKMAESAAWSTACSGPPSGSSTRRAAAATSTTEC